MSNKAKELKQVKEIEQVLQEGDAEKAKKLIEEYKGDISIDYYFPLTTAVKRGNVEMVRYLLPLESLPEDILYNMMDIASDMFKISKSDSFRQVIEIIKEYMRNNKEKIENVIKNAKNITKLEKVKIPTVESILKKKDEDEEQGDEVVENNDEDSSYSHKIEISPPLNEPNAEKCQATSIKTGNRCKNKPLFNSTFCSIHLKKSKQPAKNKKISQAKSDDAEILARLFKVYLSDQNVGQSNTFIESLSSKDKEILEKYKVIG